MIFSSKGCSPKRHPCKLWRKKRSRVHGKMNYKAYLGSLRRTEMDELEKGVRHCYRKAAKLPKCMSMKTVSLPANVFVKLLFKSYAFRGWNTPDISAVGTPVFLNIATALNTLAELRTAVPSPTSWEKPSKARLKFSSRGCFRPQKDKLYPIAMIPLSTSREQAHPLYSQIQKRSA